MKIPVEEAVQQMTDLDVLGKIKYLLDEEATHTKAIAKLIRELAAHIQAHQAIAEAREAGKCKT